MGYMSGILNGLLPARYTLGLLFIVVGLAFGSILHLFAYRYETVRGTKRLFPPYMIFIMIVGYSWVLLDPVAIVLQPQISWDVAEELMNVSGSYIEEFYAGHKIRIPDVHLYNIGNPLNA